MGEASNFGNYTIIFNRQKSQCASTSDSTTTTPSRKPGTAVSTTPAPPRDSSPARTAQAPPTAAPPPRYSTAPGTAPPRATCPRSFSAPRSAAQGGSSFAPTRPSKNLTKLATRMA